MDRDQIEARTLNASDVHDYAQRIATRAQESAESADRRIVGFFGPNFREHVIVAAEYILLALINHERSFAQLRIDAGLDQSPVIKPIANTLADQRTNNSGFEPGTR